MPHISLLIIFSTILITQPLYSMELEKKEKKHKSSSPLRKKSGGSSSPKQKNSASYHNDDQDHIPSISFNSSSTSVSPDGFQSQSKEHHKFNLFSHSEAADKEKTSKQKGYDRSNSADTTSTQQKEHHKFTLFSHSESANKEKTPKQKGYGRSKTVDTTSTRPKEPFKLKNLSVSDGATNFSSALKTSPRSKLVSSVKTIPQVKNNILVNAVKNYDFDTIKEYLKKPEANLNQTDEWGNTALHHAVIKLTDKFNSEDVLKLIITLFLEDLRTDTSIARGMDGRRALDILSGGENPEIRIPLFARATLDITTNQEIGKMALKSYIYNIPLDDNLIEQTVECIIKKIETIENEQKANHRDLPPEAKLPEYAKKNGFICKMIKYRMPAEAYHVSELQKTILKNIFVEEKNTILLNVSIDFNEKSIQESIDNILNTIITSHNYLTKFITKPCIFEILKTCVEEQTEANKPSNFLAWHSQNNNNNNNNH